MAHQPPILSADRMAQRCVEAAPVTPRPVPGSLPPPPAAPASRHQPKQNGDFAASRPGNFPRSDELSEFSSPNDESSHTSAVFRALRVLPSWFTSGFIHMLMILVLALLYLPLRPVDTFQEILLGRDDPVNELEKLVEDVIEPIEIETTTDEMISTISPSMEVPEQVTNISADDNFEAAPIAVELSDYGETTAPRNELLAVVGAYTGTGLEGRGQAARAHLLRMGGGTKESEAAVSRALKWFSNHQYYDGGWSFDHQLGPCQSRCQQPGNMKDARIAATAMALLPYLGAGQTHTEGLYKEQVRRGLYFLINSMEVKEDYLGDLWEPGGRMYSHALASIALCEAYGMTKDDELIQPAQMAVNYLIWAQNKSDGGWRYTADELVGDTSVVGWALMALKSANMAYHLEITNDSVMRAANYLDTVQKDDGAQYSYVASGAPTPATTAIGLLCRMYMGWEKEHPALQRGVDYMNEIGPMQHNFYYKYYATQVMRHMGGERWRRWNEVMRDALVASQSTAGHETGSWYVATDGHGSAGGRHYCTSMATMILEVYYRHLPIYGAKVLEDEFPL